MFLVCNIDLNEIIYHILLVSPLKKTCIYKHVQRYSRIKDSFISTNIDTETAFGLLTVRKRLYHVNSDGLNFFHKLLKKKYETEKEVKTSVLLNILFLVNTTDKNLLEIIYSRYHLDRLFRPESVSFENILNTHISAHNIKEENGKLSLTNTGVEILNKFERR